MQPNDESKTSGEVRTMQTVWADTQEEATRCSSAMDKYGELVGTTFVARDMMQIVDALGEDRMLRYWGFSYGTILGMTVAAMYPDRMDKIVLDGVVNPVEYWSGRILENVVDTEATIDGFFYHCVQNMEFCALAVDNPSASSLRKKFDNLLERLKTEPIKIRSIFGTLAIDYRKLRDVTVDLIAFTHRWPLLAQAIDQLFKCDRGCDLDPSSELNELFDSWKPIQSTEPEALFGIRCGDSGLRADMLSDVYDLVDELHYVAPLLGEPIAELVMDCAAWKLSAEERYTTPFDNIKTKNPILFIGNTFDPRTPLASAKNASAAFPGSGVLTHDAYGHCSYSQPSLCVGKAVLAYFNNGTLPAEGTICEPSVPPFHNPRYNTNTVEGHLLDNPKTASDAAWLAAWSHVGSEMSRAPRLF